MNEKTITRLFAMIQEKDRLSKKIGKLLNGKSNGKPRIIAVERGVAKPSKKRVLQGRYLGAVRPLTKTQRKQISKIREAKGYHAAIAKAKALARA